MKNYHEYQKISLGASDGAALLWASYPQSGFIPFGEDGAYSAYLVDENAEIGGHYSLVAESDSPGFLSIYDDTGLVFRERAKQWKIYRSGQFGCIIQIVDKF